MTRPHLKRRYRSPQFYGSTPDAALLHCTGRPSIHRDATVYMAPWCSHPRDDFQHWVKDMWRRTSIKDEEGYAAFALVNKVTGEAIKHSLGQSHPVRLVPYNPEYVDESVLWTESCDFGHGFRCVRMVNNIYLNFNALHGDKDHGGVRDGTNIVLWKWCEGDNQRWKIVPWCKSRSLHTGHTYHYHSTN